MKGGFVLGAIGALSSLAILPALACSDPVDDFPYVGLRHPDAGATSSGSMPPSSEPPAPDVVEPPPFSGGTLLVLADGNTVAAADPDRNRVWIADLVSLSLRHEVVLQRYDEPGRLVEDAAGRIHVALRRGGALVTIDGHTGSVVARRPVCPAPRGLAYEAAGDVIHVACADGRLVTLPAAGGDAIRTVRPDSDLRDVVLLGDTLYVSRFRSAEILELAPDGSVQQRIVLPTHLNPDMKGTHAAPSVAWRMVPFAGKSLAVLHQRAQVEAVSIKPGGYGEPGTCPGAGMVHDAVTLVSPGIAPTSAPTLANVSMAIDLALTADGSELAVAGPGGGPFGTAGRYSTDTIVAPINPCLMPSNIFGDPQTIAVAFAGTNLVMQVRDPAAIVFDDGRTIPLPGQPVDSGGMLLFHTMTKGGIACASCHPEGGDDGRVWQFDGLGPRRTQNLRGGVLARAPFHWSGDVADMDALVTEVLVGRMGGAPPGEDGTVALGAWMDSLPALLPPPSADPLAVARGAQIFTDPDVGCSTCHLGPQLSNHRLVDVGTGGMFKTPSLVGVGYRAPFLHDGCAATLHDRFSPMCGGSQHGNTAQLAPSQIDDLIAFLGSL